MPVHGIEEFTCECDRCGEQEEIAAIVYPSDGSTHSEMYAVGVSTLNEQGWTMDGEEVFCKECSASHEDDNRPS